MATTDARTGFRLPWSSDDHGHDAHAGDDARTGPAVADGEVQAEDSRDGSTLTAGGIVEPSADGTRRPGATPRAKPTKFLADLTKAMQATAEAAREDVLVRFGADAKTHVEQIHGLASDEATNLRRRADDDVAAVREWSKAEIARIREETEQRITERKLQLEREIEGNAALIERRIERVQATVAAFEAEMASFFERLLLEEDPSRFATLAGNLPEPPVLTFDGEPVAEQVAAEIPVDSPEPIGEVEGEAPLAATALPAPVTDPRIAVLGLTPDSAAAAEAEAFAAVGVDADTDGIPVIADDTLAARLADLVPADADAGRPATTDVVVVGLVSVASIAAFKRHLARLAGVQSVGVTSGPEGEFIFSVTHNPDVALRDAVPSLPGFEARVTGGNDTTVNVIARDPETDG